MAINDSMIQFSSQWEIDQRKASGEMSVGSGTTLVYTANTSYPVYEMQFKPTGSSKWFMPGVNSANNTSASTINFFPYVNGNNIYVSVNASGTIRYYVYTDKVNY